MKSCWAASPLIALLLLSVSSCAVRGEPELVFSPEVVDAGVAEVRPGDRVALRIWNEPEMSDTFTVAANAEVTLPKLGAISVDDHTVVSLQDTIQRAYSQFLRNPAIQITVLRRVGVSGEVRFPGIFLVDLTMTLPDVIARAGGLTEAGNPNSITVLRGTERVRYRTRDQEHFVVAELYSGDQVIVGTKSFIARNPMAVITTAVPLLGYMVTVILPGIRDL